MRPHTVTRNSSAAGPVAEAEDARSVAAGVRLRVLLPLAAAMLLLLFTFVSIFIFETRHRQTEDIARTAASVDVMFREQSAEGIQVVRSIMELVLQDRNLEAALRARDRPRLLELSTPILKEIRAKNRITHFYYILPDRTMLLRVQAPAKHGDRIDRFVLQEAQRTGKPFWGNEQGPLGSFTLRVAYPWISNGEVIGYLEMGIEFEDIMQSIKNFLDVNVFVVVNKSFFDRAKWEEAQGIKQHPVPWDEFPAVLVLSRTTPAIPAPIVAYLAALGEQHSRRSFEIAWDGQIAQTIVVPFANLRGQELGELVVLRNITARAAERHQAVLGVALLCTAIGGGLMLFFYALLGRVQRDVAERTARLGEAQRVLTIEHFERQRAEHELTLQQERNELLEARSRMVEELAAANDALTTEIAERKQLESRLVQSEKLASIGQLAAGVAHEINNPVGFVYSNVGTLGKYIDALLSMIAAYEEATAASGATEAVARLDALRARLELDYLKQDIPPLVKETRDGLARVRQIVQDLRDFSRIDAMQDWQLADLQQGIDATLNIVGNAVNAKADVVKEYGAIPEVECLPSQLNQVVMNLLLNAAEAIGAERGRITIRTGTAGAEVWIEVADTGAGIASENLSRIFDPFFTTQPVGKGTGLGLSVSYGIVQKHRGRIEVHSEVGKGTCFRVVLPMRRPAP